MTIKETVFNIIKTMGIGIITCAITIGIFMMLFTAFSSEALAVPCSTPRAPMELWVNKNIIPTELALLLVALLLLPVVGYVGYKFISKDDGKNLAVLPFAFMMLCYGGK